MSYLSKPSLVGNAADPRLSKNHLSGKLVKRKASKRKIERNFLSWAEIVRSTKRFSLNLLLSLGWKTHLSGQGHPQGSPLNRRSTVMANLHYEVHAETIGLCHTPYLISGAEGLVYIRGSPPRQPSDLYATGKAQIPHRSQDFLPSVVRHRCPSRGSLPSEG